MISAIIDTNCQILSIPAKNPEHWLYQAFRQKHFEWILSNEILAEYEEQVGLFYSPKTADIVLLSRPKISLQVEQLSEYNNAGN